MSTHRQRSQGRVKSLLLTQGHEFMSSAGLWTSSVPDRLVVRISSFINEALKCCDSIFYHIWYEIFQCHIMKPSLIFFNPSGKKLEAITLINVFILFYLYRSLYSWVWFIIHIYLLWLSKEPSFKDCFIFSPHSFFFFLFQVLMMGEPFFDCQIGFVGCRALCLKGIMGVRDFEENMNRCEEVKRALNS